MTKDILSSFIFYFIPEYDVKHVNTEVNLI